MERATTHSRYFCITLWRINGDPIEDILNDNERGQAWLKGKLEEICERSERIRYFIGQLEHGEGGRPHVQCYIELGGNGGVRRSGVLNLLGLRGGDGSVQMLICTTPAFFMYQIHFIGAGAQRYEILYVEHDVDYFDDKSFTKLE